MIHNENPSEEDKEAIDLLLSAPALDLNQPDDQNKTLLHLAIEQEDIHLLNNLLAKGVDPNLRDEHGKTPLQCAQAKGNQEVMDLLRDKGAVEDQVSAWQLKGSYEDQGQQIVLTIGDTLGRSQQSSDPQAQWRITNMTWSQGIKGSDILGTVLQHGENRIICTVSMDTLTEAPCVEICIQGPDRDLQRITIDLKKICEAQLEKSEKELITKHNSISEYIQETETIYQLPTETVTDPRVNREKQNEVNTLLGRVEAFHSQYEEEIEKFSNNSGILEQVNESLPVLEAQNRKLKDTIASLKSAQIQLQQQCTTAHEAFFKILKNGDTHDEEDAESLGILIDDPKLDVNARDGEGNTLLYAALFERGAQEETYLSNLLIKRNADINASAAGGTSILMHSLSSNTEHITEYLLDQRVDLNKNYEIAIGIKGNALQFLLLDAAEGIRRINKWFLYTVRQLIKFDLNVNSRDSKGKTSLHYAVMTRNLEIVKMIIAAGAKVNATCNEGLSILDECIYDIDHPVKGANEGETMPLIYVLRSHGAVCHNKHKLMTLIDGISQSDIDYLEAGIWSLWWK